MAECGIQENSLIFMVLRLRGDIGTFDEVHADTPGREFLITSKVPTEDEVNQLVKTLKGKLQAEVHMIPRIETLDCKVLREYCDQQFLMKSGHMKEQDFKIELDQE